MSGWLTGHWVRDEYSPMRNSLQKEDPKQGTHLGSKVVASLFRLLWLGG
jgi:hypothetical protein